MTKLKARLERIDALRQSILTDPGQRTLVRMLALESEWMAQVIRAQGRVIEARRAVDSYCGVPPLTLRHQCDEAESALANLLKEEW